MPSNFPIDQAAEPIISAEPGRGRISLTQTEASETILLMDEDAQQRITEELERIKEYLETLDLDGLRSPYHHIVGNPLRVCHDDEQPQIREEILAACKEDKHRRIRALRAMGERAFNPELLADMRKIYEKSVHAIISKWEIYPPIKDGSKPRRSKLLYNVNDVWQLAHGNRDVHHAWEFEQFLLEHKYFTVKDLTDRDGISIELSDAGLAYQQRFDTDEWIRDKGLRMSRWLGRGFSKAWKNYGSKVLIGVLIVVLGTIFLYAIAEWTGLSLPGTK